MTWVDLVVLAVLAISALLAFMRGLVREVLGLAAWVGAVAAAFWALPYARPRFQGWLGASPWIDPIAFAVVLLVTLIVLLLISRWVGALVRASPIGGVDRSLGLVFGLVRGAALVILAYIATGMVVPLERWPEPVLDARSLYFAYQGAHWVREKLPVEYRPRLYAPPPGRATTAEALLQANPQGRAVGRPPVRD
jgi:membrane protein required for colicin V production